MKTKETIMRLIDADELKEKLLKMQADIVDKKVQRGSSISDAWIIAYLLILDKYIKMLDEMPSMINGCNADADAIRAAYVGGFLNGREDALSEVQLIKDYYKNDCDTLNEIWKEQKMKNKEMTREEIWDKVIQNLKTLDAGLIVTIAEKLRTDVIHGTIKQEDKYQMWSLVDDLGYYSIKGQTIKYLPEYQELTTLMEKVF